MIRITKTMVSGFPAAIRGTRNALKSWAKSDSEYCDKRSSCKGCKYDTMGEDCPGEKWKNEELMERVYLVGDNDMKLLRRLTDAGSEERKGLRMVHVSCDIDAPSYWLAEFVTYKIGTTQNSTSVQHTGASKDFEISDFMLTDGLQRIEGESDEEFAYREECWKKRLEEINYYRKKYKETKNYDWFIELRNVLASSFIYRITFDCNYEVLLNMYRQRKNHRLPGWTEYCSWIEDLPYMRELMEKDSE